MWEKEILWTSVYSSIHPWWLLSVCASYPIIPSILCHPYIFVYLPVFLFATCLSSYLYSWQPPPFSGFHSFYQTVIVLLKKPVGDGFRILQGCSVGILEARDWKQYGVWLYPSVNDSNAEFCVQFCVLIWSWLVCAVKEQLPFLQFWKQTKLWTQVT